jgi:hypothetical protein
MAGTSPAMTLKCTGPRFVIAGLDPAIQKQFNNL